MNREMIEARLGQRVGRWRLQEVLGVGAMAAVYRGAASDGSEVAVKVMHAEHGANAAITGRFLREAHIMGLSSHPRAVKIITQGYTELNEPFYAMELLGSETLERRRKIVELFDPLRALGYISSLLEVLETYHTHGVVHRDIKPENLVMDGDAVRIVDFGVSRYRDDSLPEEEYTRQGSQLGTPAYMAPEQAIGKVDRIDARTDLFAVGAVLYVMLCGRKLHHGMTAEEQLLAAGSQPAESIARYAPELPGILIQYVDRSVSWFQEERFQSAAEMLDELFHVKAVVQRELAPKEELAPAPTLAEPPPGRIEESELEDRFGGAGIMPAGFEVPDFSDPTPARPADASGPEEAFPTAMLEPDSEAWGADEFDSDIFKPSSEFAMTMERGDSPSAADEPESADGARTDIFSRSSDPRPKFATGGRPSTRSDTFDARPDSAAARRPAPLDSQPKSGKLSSPFTEKSDVDRAAAIAFGSHADVLVDDLEEESGWNPEVLVEMFRAIERVFVGARMYDWEHPDVARRLRLALDAVLEVLSAYPDHCAFQVRRSDFVVKEMPVWQPDEALDTVPFNLFSAGFRHVQFLPNLTESDLGAFLKLATLNPRTDLSIEDDLATAFWDLDLKSIRAQMVTTFTVSDDADEQAAFDRAVATIEAESNAFLLDDGGEQLRVLMSLAELGEGALAEAHYSRPELLLARRLNRGTFAPEYREQFAEALDHDIWLQRAVFVLVAALLDVVAEGDSERLSEPLRELVPRFLLEDDPKPLFELIDKVVRTLPDDEHRSLVFEWVFDERNVDRFVRFLAQRDEPLDDETAARARGYLPEGDRAAAGEVLKHFVTFEPERREIVGDYLRKSCSGNQGLYAEAALRAQREVAMELLKMISAVHDPATATALRDVLDHPDPGVREAALIEMARQFPAEVDDILLEMVSDSDANIRVQALKLASATGSRAVESHLTETARGSGFHELPFTERRLVLETLFEIDVHKGQLTAIELIGRKLNLRLDPAVHTTRTIAISLLGERGTMQAAFEALEEIAKRRLGNPGKVRDAASAAIERWKERS